MLNSAPGGRALERVLDRLSSMHRIGAGERELARRVGGVAQIYRADQDLFSSDREPSRMRFILSGWAARTATLRDGRVQIVSFLIPGDVANLIKPSQTGMSTAITTLTRVEAIDGERLCADIEARMGASSQLSAACRLSASSDREALLEQIVRLGLLNASERMARLFHEVYSRLNAVGLCDDYSFDLPLRQEHLAQCLGMTLVHANRVLQGLRSEGLIALQAGRATILQPSRLAARAQLERPFTDDNIRDDRANAYVMRSTSRNARQAWAAG